MKSRDLVRDCLEEARKLRVQIDAKRVGSPLRVELRDPLYVETLLKDVALYVEGVRAARRMIDR
jgi:hypothetical protein